MLKNFNFSSLRPVVLPVLASVLIQSCVPAVEEPVAQPDFQRVETFPFTVEVAAPECKAPDAKSSFPDESLQKITDLNVFVYYQGCLIKECSRYFPDMDTLMLSFPYGKNDFNVYMLGNVGQIDPPSEEYRLTSLKYVAHSYEEFLSHGFPVAGAFFGYRKGQLAHFELTRMVGQYNVRVKVSAENAKYKITDVRLKNCAMDVLPFGEGTGASVFECSCEEEECVCGDRLTETEVMRLNLGLPVSLYFMENIQGVLLPWNTDPCLKIPSSLDPGMADRCTYMEVTADVNTLTARYRNVKYRFYLGQDQTSDFSIVRNTLYDVLLDFTQNMVSEEEWRIEAGEPSVVDVRLNKTEAMVIRGAEDMVYVQAFDNSGKLMDFDVECSGAMVEVEKVSTKYSGLEDEGDALGLRLTSNVPLCGLYPYGAEPTYTYETVRISSRETYNGVPLYSKDIRVRVYDKLFPLLMKIEKNDDAFYEVVLRGQNPMGLGLSMSVAYTGNGKSYSLAETAAVSYIGKDGVLINGAVGVRGKSMGTLDVNTKPSNLSSVDFRIAGVGAIAGSDTCVLAYPKMLSSEPVYVGEGNKAMFGPGSSRYPAKYALTDDAAVSLNIRDYGYDVGLSSSEHAGWASDDDYSSVFNVVQTLPFDSYSGFRYLDYTANSGNKVLFEFRNGMGVHVPSVGSFLHAGHGFQKENASLYEACPFYFVNGGLTLFYTTVYWNHDLVVYPDKESNGFTFKLYGAGRDLFPENSDGTLVNNVHEMKFCVNRWKNLVGKIKTEQSSRSYKGQLYMTVNGSTTWTGCDTSEFGFYP